MSKIEISSPKDLYKLKRVSQVYDQVNINLKRLKTQGLVRHAVKYSANALKMNGLLVINTSPFVSYNFRKFAIDFWQVKYEVFNSLKDVVEVVDINSKEGKLVLRKKKHLYSYTGISFGILFSGDKQEELQLIAVIKSISANEELKIFSYEILICGPEDYNFSNIRSEFPLLNLRYLALNIATTPRLMICDKKNLLYNSAQFSLVVISHCRILFSSGFVKQLVEYPIEMATPAVYFVDNDKEYKYLDIGFLGSYQDIQFGSSRSAIAGDNIHKDYLPWYSKRVPYIDGGLNVFNKNIVKEPPYNKYISWGEAEDVDVCNNLFQNGILIDYLPEIKSYSVTNKLRGYGVLKMVGRRISRWIKDCLFSLNIRT
jgi:hypothetical protein